MSMYRIYQYPDSDIFLKHVYLKRDREVKRDEKSSPPMDKSLVSDSKFESSLSRSRRVVRDLALCNPFEYFCTFTFDSSKVDRYNLSECSKKLRQFFNNYKKRYAADFKYLIIPEFHSDRAVHFHGLCSGFADGDLTIPDFIFKRFMDDVVLVPNTKKYVSWVRYENTFGHFNCSRIKDRDRVAFYICKYIMKDPAVTDKGHNLFMCSQGLKRPELVFGVYDVPLLFEATFENEFCCLGYTDVNGSVVLGDRSDYPFGFGQYVKEVEQEFKEEIFTFDTGVQLCI